MSNYPNNQIKGQKEYGIDCMMYRKSTHLAGVDVEMIQLEKGTCILTIKEAYYQTDVNVSGKKVDAYIIEFIEPVKNMVVNSTNRKIITELVKNNTKLSMPEARNIGNWKGLKIELYFDPTVKMKGEEVGGIKVKLSAPPTVDYDLAISFLSDCKTIDELKESWMKLSNNEKNHPLVLKFKEELKAKLSS